MQKQILSIEQMQKLAELGVDTSKASMCWIKQQSTGDIGLVMSESANKKGWTFYDLIPAFTLQDILEMLPKKIDDDWNSLCLDIEWECGTYTFAYSSCFRYKQGSESENILEAAFDMLVWVVENGYLKKGE